MAPWRTFQVYNTPVPKDFSVTHEFGNPAHSVRVLCVAVARSFDSQSRVLIVSSKTVLFVTNRYTEALDWLESMLVLDSIAMVVCHSGRVCVCLQTMDNIVG